jgi:hypothetical protein
MIRAEYNYDGTADYRARYYDPSIGKFISIEGTCPADPYRLAADVGAEQG